MSKKQATLRDLLNENEIGRARIPSHKYGVIDLDKPVCDLTLRELGKLTSIIDIQDLNKYTYWFLSGHAIHVLMIRCIEKNIELFD